MQQEVEITINGVKLTEMESMVVRAAIDSLANVLGKALGFKDDGIPIADFYMTSLSRIRMTPVNTEFGGNKESRWTTQRQQKLEHSSIVHSSSCY